MHIPDPMSEGLSAKEEKPPPDILDTPVGYDVRVVKEASKVNLDKVGAFASTLCAIHCLLTGVALGLLSILGLGFVGSKAADALFLIVTLSVASIAIFTGLRKHGSYLPSRFFVLGVMSIVISHFVLDHESKDIGTRVLTTTLAVLGGVFLVTFHVVNLRLQKSCKH